MGGHALSMPQAFGQRMPSPGMSSDTMPSPLRRQLSEETTGPLRIPNAGGVRLVPSPSSRGFAPRALTISRLPLSGSSRLEARDAGVPECCSFVRPLRNGVVRIRGSALGGVSVACSSGFRRPGLCGLRPERCSDGVEVDQGGCPDGLEGRFSSSEVAAVACVVAVDDQSEQPFDAGSGAVEVLALVRTGSEGGVDEDGSRPREREPGALAGRRGSGRHQALRRPPQSRQRRAVGVADHDAGPSRAWRCARLASTRAA